MNRKTNLRNAKNCKLHKLSFAELSELARYESLKPNNGTSFYRIGETLRRINEKRLYRYKFENFDDYCHEVWKYRKAYAYQLIGASQVFKYLSKCNEIQILPTHENQVRPLIGLKPDQIREAWQKAVKSAHSGKVTGKLVKECAQKFRNKRKSQSIHQANSAKPKVDVGRLKRIIQMIDELEIGLNMEKPKQYLIKRIKSLRKELNIPHQFNR